jgi:hypothetical protein
MISELDRATLLENIQQLKQYTGEQKNRIDQLCRVAQRGGLKKMPLEERSESLAVVLSAALEIAVAAETIATLCTSITNDRQVQGERPPAYKVH